MKKENNIVVKNQVILKFIQDLQRLSLQFINSIRGRYPAGRPIKYGMTILNNGGFTLIELLVVVLIIGILAAVAVPQYQIAVEKSRAVQAITLARALHDAQEAYYLENGQYAYSKTQLPVVITCPTDYMCIVNSLKIEIKHKDYYWNILYSHNYRSDAAAYAKGKFYCWDNRAKTVCSKLGKRWWQVDSNMYLLN